MGLGKTLAVLDALGVSPFINKLQTTPPQLRPLKNKKEPEMSFEKIVSLPADPVGKRREAMTDILATGTSKVPCPM